MVDSLGLECITRQNQIPAISAPAVIERMNWYVGKPNASWRLDEWFI
jgi:hypothetical protein